MVERDALAYAAFMSLSSASAQAAAHGRDIVELDAVSLSQAIATRALSCVEVLQAYLAQIERLNPRVNALEAP